MNYAYLDIECVKELPDIPTDPEYKDSLEKNDGRVIVEAKVYPSGKLVNQLLLSSTNSTDIPKNYNANITWVFYLYSIIN